MATGSTALKKQAAEWSGLEGLDLVPRRDEIDRVHGAHEGAGFRIETRLVLEVAADAIDERAGLADVDDITLGVEHAVDAGGGGQCLQIAGDDRGARFRRGNGFGARVTGDFAVGSVFNGRLV